MCDEMKTEKADFIKALDGYISARIFNGIKNYHHRKGEYEWLSFSQPGTKRYHEVKCDGCLKWVKTNIEIK